MILSIEFVIQYLSSNCTPTTNIEYGAHFASKRKLKIIILYNKGQSCTRLRHAVHL